MELESKKFWNFVFELGQLRNVRHEGWRLAGVENIETVAAHSLRVAQIGYVLAIMEDHPEPEKVCSMCVFHDVGETRVGDIHRVASRYVTCDERSAVKEQLEPLGEIGSRLDLLWNEYEDRTTPAGVIAKDADYLDMMAMAKEYLERGYPAAQDWVNNIEKALKTESAKRMATDLKLTDTHDWWQGLKKLPKN